MTDLAGSTRDRLALAGLRRQLLEARGELLALAYGGPGAVQQDEADGAALAQREAGAALDRMQRTALAEVNAALDRFDDGTYGACTRCGQPIPVERLEVMPAASRCVGCQAQREGGR